MPLAGEALPTAQIELLRAWVDAGAPWPETAGATPVDAGKPSEMIVSEWDRQHWAFRPLQPTRPPAVRDVAWIRNPIDRYILTALEAKGLKPGPEASKGQLIRRASFTLAGLPPTPEEIETFRNDRSAKAYQSVVERLLASPHFGERWGRHWLDVARYADSEGYNRDRDRPLMYRYRDFVIRAMNSDMPFNQFVSWQLAGDEYEPDNPEAVTATGFLAAGPSEEITITDTDENKLKYYTAVQVSEITGWRGRRAVTR